MEAWRNFNTGVWCDQIDVSNFIKMNYTPYDGDSSFLQGPTERTERTMKRVNELLIEENEKGGVLDVDTERVLSILSHDAGYVVDKDTDIIVGLQTDAPLKRGVSPFAGLRNTVQACNAYGYELSEKIKDAFTYRTTHNTGVFPAYTDTMKVFLQVFLMLTLVAESSVTIAVSLFTVWITLSSKRSLTRKRWAKKKFLMRKQSTILRTFQSNSTL